MNILPTFKQRIARGTLLMSFMNVGILFIVLLLSKTLIINSISNSYLDNLATYIEEDFRYILLVDEPYITDEALAKAINFPFVSAINIYNPASGNISFAGPENARNTLDYQRTELTYSNNASQYTLNKTIYTSGDSNELSPIRLSLSIDGSIIINIVNNIYIILLLSFLGVTVLFWIYASYFSHSVSKSITSLNNALINTDPSALAGDMILPEPDSKEVYNIVQTLRDLLLQISDNQSQLETKVDERTSELARALLMHKSSEDQRKKLIINLSHDLKTPLTSNIGFINIAIEMLDDNLHSSNKELKDLLTKALQHGFIISNEIDTLLQYTASEDVDAVGHSSAINLSDFVSERITYFDQLSKTSNNRVSYSHVGVAEIETSPRLLKHILDNLISNALKFCRNGQIIVNTIVDSDGVTITVKDDGVGFSYTDVDRVFDLYFQAPNSVSPNQGTGLGLAMTKIWVELLGGIITAYSNNKNDTVFTVVLPPHR